MFWKWKFYILGGKQKTHLFFTILIYIFLRTADMSKLKFNPMGMFCTLVQKKQNIGQLFLVTQVSQQFFETQQFSVIWVAISLIFCNNGSFLLTLACQNTTESLLGVTGTELRSLGHSEWRWERTWDTAGKSVSPVAPEEHLEVEWWIWRGDSVHLNGSMRSTGHKSIGIQPL